MNNKSLFRQEVFNKTRNQYYGNVSINTPIHYLIPVLGSLVLVLLIIIFIFFAEFSEKFIVTGYLNSANGTVFIHADKSGVIVNSYVNQGVEVKKGDKLFLIDTSYDGLNNLSHSRIVEQLKKRIIRVIKEMDYKKMQLQEFKDLLEKKYISLTLFNEKKSEISALENERSNIEMELIKYKQDSYYIIRSPVDGMASSVVYKKGQHISSGKFLMKILPNENLVAELFVPVRQSGFLDQKSKIILHYDAYPYDRFGAYSASIKEISQSILTDQEEEKPISIGQPYYKVTANLNNQFVTLYGNQKKIQHGMTFSAVIVGSKKKVWQWILDPLFSFYGEQFT